MKFKEQFPGLSKFSVHREVVLGKAMDIVEIPTDIIQEYCLDKQKVIDAIYGILGKEDYQGDMFYRKLLLKELNLEE